MLNNWDRFFVSAAAFIISTAAALAALPEEIAVVMEEQAANGFSGYALVMIDDDIVFHEAYGLADRKTNTLMTKDTIISAGSLSKQVTTAAVVLLEARGRLSLDDSLWKYFENVPDDKQDITIRQLMSHAAGFGWALPNDFIPIAEDDWIELVFSEPLLFTPGTGYHYSNDGISLAAIIVQRVSGKPFRTFIRETFFDPLDMNHSGWFDDPVFDNDESLTIATGYFNGKDDGAPNEWPQPYWPLLGNGGIIWTASDLLKWHRALHGDLLPAGARDKLFDPVVEVTDGRPAYGGEMPLSYYALGWRVGTTICGDKRIGHGGAGVSHNVDYRYYPERDTLIYVASNKIDHKYGTEERMFSLEAANAIAELLVRDCTAGN